MVKKVKVFFDGGGEEGFQVNPFPIIMIFTSGFQTLVLALVSVPVLLGHGVSLAPVTDHYSLLMTSAILVSIILASLTYLGARLSGGGQELTNPISDLYHGLELHPHLPNSLGGAGLKLQLFRLDNSFCQAQSSKIWTTFCAET